MAKYSALVSSASEGAVTTGRRMTAALTAPPTGVVSLVSEPSPISGG
jgi:hypothetical protein